MPPARRAEAAGRGREVPFEIAAVFVDVLPRAADFCGISPDISPTLSLAFACGIDRFVALLKQRHKEVAMKVFGYVRVSTAEQANSGMSLDQQQQQITGYAMMKGWTVAAFFVEAGVSGSTPLADRPEGRRMLAGLEPGDVIITAKLDRAFRSAADALGTLEQLKDDGIGLHMIDLGGDVTGNGISKLVFTILSAVAENERDRIRERVRDAKRHRASQHLYNGGKRPFGFDIRDGALVPNEAEQTALEAGRTMQANGLSLRAVASEWKHTFGLGDFDAKTVKRILDRANEVAA